MENLENYKIASLGLALQRKGDLLYHEGPLLTHFINSENANEHYFYKWSDIDENCNRWLIFKVTIENLTSFFEGSITLLQLIQNNQFVYFVDLDTDINEVNAFICPTNKIPNDYLPSGKSFFKESQYEKYALTLRNELQKEAKSSKENEIMEVLLIQLLAIKNKQQNQDTLLEIILNKLNRGRQNDEYLSQSILLTDSINLSRSINEPILN
ncbi:MAG: hypothetical protein EAZ85_03405 [Bacteroidetes bacterium]|nr:MAG: hypothetical protein EAZ85_03405 [Bacteroidota bacterium]TAG93955.1 MAG: hypothetical protein EAZ20_01275 [Bacteroidota bacterium]